VNQRTDDLFLHFSSRSLHPLRLSNFVTASSGSFSPVNSCFWMEHHAFQQFYSGSPPPTIVFFPGPPGFVHNAFSSWPHCPSPPEGRLRHTCCPLRHRQPSSTGAGSPFACVQAPFNSRHSFAQGGLNSFSLSFSFTVATVFTPP